MNITVRHAARRDLAAPLLVLFHEDGTSEREGLMIGRKVWPGAPLASLRGHHPERTGWRHLSEPAREPAVLGFETAAVDRMADAVAVSAKREPQLVEVIGVGIGGGADAVLALLCRHPALFAAAVLCWPRRHWSRDSIDEVVQGNGVEVLIVVKKSSLSAALAARLMLSLAGHHTEIKVAPRKEEVAVCGAWLRRELRGDNGDAEEEHD